MINKYNEILYWDRDWIYIHVKRESVKLSGTSIHETHYVYDGFVLLGWRVRQAFPFISDNVFLGIYYKYIYEENVC